MNAAESSLPGGGGGEAPDHRTASPPGAVPALDLEQLRESTLDDAEFGRELAAVFFQQTEEQLTALGVALAEQDADALRALAHRLQGGALALGALRVHAEAAAMEDAASRGDLVAAESALGRVRSAFDEVRSLLEAHFEAARP